MKAAKKEKEIEPVPIQPVIPDPDPQIFPVPEKPEIHPEPEIEPIPKPEKPEKFSK